MICICTLLLPSQVNGSITTYCILLSIMPLKKTLYYIQYMGEIYIVKWSYTEWWNRLTYMNMELSYNISEEKILWRVVFSPTQIPKDRLFYELVLRKSKSHMSGNQYFSFLLFLFDYTFFYRPILKFVF